MTLTLSQLLASGLSSAEAAKRLAANGPNELPTAKPKNLFQQIWSVIKEPMLLLLLIAGVINLIIADPIDGILLFVMVLIVIAISVYQEGKSEKALAALRDLSAPRALVIRDNQQQRVTANQLVTGDLIVLSEGDRVPADAVLLESVNFSVDESSLTGESVSVRKTATEASGKTSQQLEIQQQNQHPGGDSTPWVFSGTLVVKGHGVALVQATGSATELGKIGKALKEMMTERTGLQLEINRLVRVIAVLGVGAATVVTVVFGFTRADWLQGLLAGIATAMAMLPEEFPVVLTVFLALGAWRLSKEHVLARRSAVIETLGSATVICVDKTGTLTQNSMTVREFMVRGNTHPVTEADLPEEFEQLAEYAILASAIDAFDPMDKAFKKIGASHLKRLQVKHSTWKLVREYPLSENLLAISHVWQTSTNEPYLVAAKGAPEAIAKLCSLSTADTSRLETQVQSATASGRRVLAVARAVWPAENPLPQEQPGFKFELLGLAALQDPIREDVPKALAECYLAGVRTVMITGDYPGTAIAIAKEIGLQSSGGVITGSELEQMSDAELAIKIRDVSVFARMVPEQKLRLIRALKANGEVVAMTGDGVNDAPALRAADIGIAMGARGTDVAREAASLVLTDDDFSSIVAGIRNGRGIFENMRKAFTYLIAVHVPIFGMTLIPVLAGNWPLVLVPVLIALLELIIDPASSVVFESEPLDKNAMKQKPRGLGTPIFEKRVLLIALSQGVASLAAVFGVYLWALLSGSPEETVRTISFVTLVISNLLVILVNRSWKLSAWSSLRKLKNPALKWILGISFVLLVALMNLPFVLDALNLAYLSLTQWLIAIAAASASAAAFEIYKKLAN